MEKELLINSIDVMIFKMFNVVIFNQSPSEHIDDAFDALLQKQLFKIDELNSIVEVKQNEYNEMIANRDVSQPNLVGFRIYRSTKKNIVKDKYTV